MIHKGLEAQKQVLKGILETAESVATTLGAGGCPVHFLENVQTQQGQIFKVAWATKDGVTVLKKFSLEHLGQLEELGFFTVRDASIATLEKAGDATTATAVVLAAIAKGGVQCIEEGYSRTDLKEEIEAAAEEAILRLKELSKPVQTENDLLNIATISTNNNVEMGKIVVDAYNKAGENGIVYVEAGKAPETYIETIDGFSFESGYVSPYFANTENMAACKYEGANILLLNERVTQKTLSSFFDFIPNKSTPLVVISEDFEPTTVAFCAGTKMQGRLQVCLVKSPEFGVRRNELMEDIAAITGGQYCNKENGLSLESIVSNLKQGKAKIGSFLGKANIITDIKRTSIMTDFESTPTAIERLNAVKKEMETEKEDTRLTFLKKRIQNFSGSIATIVVGGKTESEVAEKKDRFDDAVCAVKSAKEEGYVAGGGATLNHISTLVVKNTKGANVLCEALEAPMKAILANADYPKDKPINVSYGFGVNAKTRKECNLFDEGIIDATKAMRCVIEHAVSKATLFLNTKVFITPY